MSDEVIRREFPAVLEPVGDGRTLDVRIVPYNTVARVSDGGPAYDEEWAPGVFDNQLRAANRVLVNVEHEKGFGGVVGRGHELRDATDGFHGSFRVLDGPDGDKALQLVNDGSLTHVSLEAIPQKSERTEAGVVRRVKARLINIALCRFPAFEGAEILAVREEPAPEPELEPEPEPLPDPSHIDETLARIGVTPMTRMTVVERPWDKNQERFTDEEYAASCLVERSFPVLEPNGDLNREAMRAASRNLLNSTLPIAVKGEAARKLIRYYAIADEEPSQAISTLASR